MSERRLVMPASEAGIPLEVAINANLQSAWFAISNGARDRSVGDTICSINVGPLFTHIAVCDNLAIIDTACVELGWDSIKYSPDRQVTFISDGAETFLDAVAKRIFVGTVVEEKMQWTLGELIAETIANLIFRPKPPQVSQRLACTEPMGRDYRIRSCFISGEIVDAVGAEIDNKSNLLPFLAVGLVGALRDRKTGYICGSRTVSESPSHCAQAEREFELAFAGMQLDAQDYNNTPVLALPHRAESAPAIKFSDRHDEWCRRFEKSNEAPVVVAADEATWKHVSLSDLPRSAVPLIVAEPRFDYLSGVSRDRNKLKAIVKTLVFE